MSSIVRLFLIIFILIGGGFSFWYFSQVPSLDRDWNDDQKILAEISFSGTKIGLKNGRNFDYKSEKEYTIDYYDTHFDTTKLSRAWYIIEPFGERDGPAHTMLAFDFSDGQHVAVSAEIRKEK